MKPDIISFLDWFEHTPIYVGWIVFFAWYPMLTGLMWILTSLTYWWARERHVRSAPPVPADPPFMSLIIPMYCEGRNIEGTIRAALDLDYPRYEILLVDDASTDDTLARVWPFLNGKVRLVRKLMNEGKAMALNDGLRCARGEVIVVIDADAKPAPDLLRWLAPHFQSPRVGAVTGNPRVANRGTLLARLQAIEFTSIVSLQKRAQRVWGRI